MKILKKNYKIENQQNRLLIDNLLKESEKQSVSFIDLISHNKISPVNDHIGLTNTQQNNLKEACLINDLYNQIRELTKLLNDKDNDRNEMKKDKNGIAVNNNELNLLKQENHLIKFQLDEIKRKYRYIIDDNKSLTEKMRRVQSYYKVVQEQKKESDLFNQKILSLKGKEKKNKYNILKNISFNREKHDTNKREINILKSKNDSIRELKFCNKKIALQLGLNNKKNESITKKMVENVKKRDDLNITMRNPLVNLDQDQINFIDKDNTIQNYVRQNQLIENISTNSFLIKENENKTHLNSMSSFKNNNYRQEKDKTICFYQRSENRLLNHSEDLNLLNKINNQEKAEKYNKDVSIFKIKNNQRKSKLVDEKKIQSQREYINKNKKRLDCSLDYKKLKKIESHNVSEFFINKNVEIYDINNVKSISLKCECKSRNQHEEKNNKELCLNKQLEKENNQFTNEIQAGKKKALELEIQNSILLREKEEINNALIQCQIDKEKIITQSNKEINYFKTQYCNFEKQKTKPEFKIEFQMSFPIIISKPISLNSLNNTSHNLIIGQTLQTILKGKKLNEINDLDIQIINNYIQEYENKFINEITKSAICKKIAENEQFKYRSTREKYIHLKFMLQNLIENMKMQDHTINIKENNFNFYDNNAQTKDIIISPIIQSKTPISLISNTNKTTDMLNNLKSQYLSLNYFNETSQLNHELFDDDKTCKYKTKLINELKNILDLNQSFAQETSSDNEDISELLSESSKFIK